MAEVAPYIRLRGDEHISVRREQHQLVIKAETFNPFTVAYIYAEEQSLRRMVSDLIDALEKLGPQEGR